MEDNEGGFLEGDGFADLSGISVLSDVSNHDLSGRLDDPDFQRPLARSRKRRLALAPTGPTPTVPPKPPRKKSDGPRLKCPHCSKDYVSRQTLHAHLKKVNYTEACLRLPDDERIIEEVTTIAPVVLEAMREEEPDGVGDEGVLLLLAAMHQALLLGEDSIWMFLTAVAMSICKILRERGGVGGDGALQSMVDCGIGSLFSNLHFMSGLVEQVKWVAHAFVPKIQSKTIYYFLYQFYKRSCDGLVIWLLREMKPDKPASFPKQQPNHKLAQSEEAACYFAIGSVIHGDKGRSSKKPRLGADHFTKGAECVPNRISGFTNSQNRGGLKLSNIKYYEYAQSLILVFKGEVWRLISKEANTSHDRVFKHILMQGQATELWKKILGDIDPSSDASVWAFEYYTRKILNTFMRGTINLLKNSRNQDQVNLALRAKLAGSSQASSSC